jgi:membrane-associated phospholipid phosphatase
MKLFFKAVSFLGSLYFFLSVIMLTFFFMNQDYSIKLFLSLAITLIITFTIRFFYFKQRPNKKKYKNLFQRLYNSSFPSVHAARAIILAYFFSKIYSNIFFIVGFWLIALLVCYSRIYMKDHYLIDVISGGLLGLIISILIL